MDQSAETPPNPKVEVLIANITDLMDEAEEMLRDSTSQHAEEQVELLSLPGDTVRKHFADIRTGAGRALSAGAQHADATIRAHPYESLAVALSAGVLGGVLLARRD